MNKKNILLIIFVATFFTFISNYNAAKITCSYNDLCSPRKTTVKYTYSDEEGPAKVTRSKDGDREILTSSKYSLTPNYFISEDGTKLSCPDLYYECGLKDRNKYVMVLSPVAWTENPFLAYFNTPAGPVSGVSSNVVQPVVTTTCNNNYTKEACATNGGTWDTTNNCCKITTPENVDYPLGEVNCVYDEYSLEFSYKDGIITYSKKPEGNNAHKKTYDIKAIHFTKEGDTIKCPILCKDSKITGQKQTETKIFSSLTSCSSSGTTNPDTGNYNTIDNSSSGDTCNSVLGQDATDWLNKIFMGVKIIAPLLLIAYSMFDYGKAITSGDEEAKAKATKTVVKRFIVAIIIFLLPTLLKFIMTVTGLIGDCTIS